MSATKEGGIKAAATNKARHGEDLVKALEKAYDELDEARGHLYKAGFTILAYEVQELYEEIEEILDIIYEARKEKE